MRNSDLRSIGLKKYRLSSDVTVIHPDGSTELRPKGSFRKRRNKGVCPRCHQPVKRISRQITGPDGNTVRWTVLADIYGYQGQEHACPAEHHPDPQRLLRTPR